MSSVLRLPLPSAQPCFGGSLCENLRERGEMKSLMKPLLLEMGVTFLVALGTTPLMAQTVIDPQIYVCTRCTDPAGLEPNPNSAATHTTGRAANPPPSF